MARVRIDWNFPAFEEIRRLPKVQDDLRDSADKIADSCGDGFEAKSGQGRSRSRAAVVATTVRANRRNARDNTILRNVDAGRIS